MPSSSAPARPSRAILPIEGRELKGIHFAMDFLTANTKSILDSHKNGNFISADGKDVIVIGGGDTGTDCVGTSMRHGCKSPRASGDSAEAAAGTREGQSVAGVAEGLQARLRPGRSRREIRRRPARLSHDRDEVRRRRTRPRQSSPHRAGANGRRNDKGQFIPKNVPGTEKVLPAQLVLLAMGFLGPEQPLLDALGVERDARTNIKAEFEKYTTNITGVFAAGDCRRGQSLVVWAFNEGRGAARECDRYLMGGTDLP